MPDILSPAGEAAARAAAVEAMKRSREAARAGGAAAAGAAVAEARPAVARAVELEAARRAAILAEERRTVESRVFSLTQEVFERESLERLKHKYEEALQAQFPDAPAEERIRRAEQYAQRDLNRLQGEFRNTLIKSERLATARDTYVRTQEAMRKYEGVVGTFRGFISVDKKSQAERELDAAKQEYERLRGEVLGRQIDRHLDERGRVADRVAEAVKTREGSWAKELYNGYKKLGEWNLEKVLKPETKVGKFLCRIASVRTLISGSLLGLGLWAGGGVAVGAAAIGLRRVMAGVGTAGFSYDLMNHHARAFEKTKGKLSELKEDEVKLHMGDAEIIDRIAAFETDARLHGEKVSENPTYKMLLKIWRERVERRRGETTSTILDRRMKELDAQFEKVLGSRERADNWRKTGALSLGLLIGSGKLAEGVRNVKELIWGAEIPPGAHAPAAVEHPTGPPKPSDIPVEGGGKVTPGGEIVDVPIDPDKAFGGGHSLLRDSGFHLSIGPDGKTGVVWAEIGKGGQFEHIQQALRRLVVDAMDPVKLHGAGQTFDYIDAGRAENVVANLTRILEQHHSTLDLSPAELEKYGISFDGKTLKILDHDQFAKLFNEKFMSHAEAIITNQSDALAVVDNTGHGKWQDMWDMKMKGNEIVKVGDFAHDKFVTAAEHRVFNAHVKELGLGEDVKVVSITDEDTGLFKYHDYAIKVDHDVVKEIVAPDGARVPLPEGALNVKEAVTGARLSDLVDRWDGAHGAAKEAARALAEQNFRLVEALEVPSGTQMVVDPANPNLINVTIRGGDRFVIELSSQGDLMRVGGHLLSSTEQVPLADSEAVMRVLKTPHAFEDLYRPKEWGGIVSEDGMVSLGGDEVPIGKLAGVSDQAPAAFVGRYAETVSIDQAAEDYVRLAQAMRANPDSGARTIGDYLVRHAGELESAKYHTNITWVDKVFGTPETWSRLAPGGGV